MCRLAGPRVSLLLILTTALLTAKALAQASAQLLLPSAIAYDQAGNIYFADTNRNQVLEATLAGQLIVVAGSGVQGFAGDGGAATNAELNAPQGVTVGADGTVYIADTGNQRIRAVAANIISTIAGNGVRGFSGDGGAATAAEFSSPIGLSLDASGGLFVCDSANQRVRKISSGMISTFAGSGMQGFAGDGSAAVSAELDTPMGVAAATDGRIFIADTNNHRVRLVTAAGIISTFAGTGVQGFAGDGAAATAARLSRPRGLVLMPSGALLIADENNQRVRMVDVSGVISTAQGTGVQGPLTSDGVNVLVAMLNSPRAVGISAFAQPAVVDSANKLLRVETSDSGMYSPAGLTAARVSSVELTVPATAVYGQLQATVVVSGKAGVAQGSVTWMEGGSAVGTGNLSNGSASTVLQALNTGVHVLNAVYGGDGLNPAATSANANVTVTKAASSVTDQVSAQGYAGYPMVMTAVVSPATLGTPTGEVSFLDGANVVASAVIVNGVATGTYVTPASGVHTLTASYGGDSNFLASASAVTTVTVAAVPDFSVSVMNSSESVQGGLIATYAIAVSGQGAFSGAVNLTASGLPAGATVTFSPQQVVPGSGLASSTMSVQTTAAMAQNMTPISAWWALCCVIPLLVLRRRRAWSVIGAMFIVVVLVGCGTRSVTADASLGRNYTFTITGTGTNLTGSTVAHSVVVTLMVE